MNINLLEEEIIIGNNTLSDKGREDVIYEIMEIYEKIPNPMTNLTIMILAAMNDKALVITLISAYQYFAVKYFMECGRKPESIPKGIDI